MWEMNLWYDLSFLQQIWLDLSWEMRVAFMSPSRMDVQAWELKR